MMMLFSCESLAFYILFQVEKNSASIFAYCASSSSVNPKGSSSWWVSTVPEDACFGSFSTLEYDKLSDVSVVDILSGRAWNIFSIFLQQVATREIVLILRPLDSQK
mmetsp:Transcript_6671/g.12544  ORF Transcript_6671/g.12544 Transcript_6671/m.12544 type:complete len:106 (+) Transcript_6671:302-619(+)